MALNPYRMAWSFRIGRLFGIDVRVHIIFLVLVAWVWLDGTLATRNFQDGAFILLHVLLLFTFVLLHELGHSLVAQRAGIRVRDITIWPLGGLARLEGSTDEPRTELKIALAGPAVNLAIALAVLPFWLTMEPTYLTDFLLFANAALGIFNLIPAFPLDGGRVLRALLGFKMSFLKATEKAVLVSKILAISGIFISIVYLDKNWWLVLICLFVLWAGSTELRAVRTREFWRRAAQEEAGDIIDAEVVESNLKDYERQFIKEIRRLGGGDKGS
jgi:Zn-dependent protease